MVTQGAVERAAKMPAKARSSLGTSDSLCGMRPWDPGLARPRDDALDGSLSTDHARCFESEAKALPDPVRLALGEVLQWQRAERAAVGTGSKELPGSTDRSRPDTLSHGIGSPVAG